MLKKLTVKNYILIDELTIDFGTGLSVITGETGAGKSVLVGTLNLLCGLRSDAKAVGTFADKSIIEGTFDITGYNLSDMFDKNDVDYYPECVIRREITASGKSRSFINDTPVTLSFLKDVGDRLIDVHSQHQNLLLADNRFQINAVDVFAGNSSLLKNYSAAYLAHKEKEIELRRYIAEQEKNAKDAEYQRFVLSQLAEAALSEDEDILLEEERRMLSHAEEIKGSLYNAVSLLDGDDGILTKLSSVYSSLRAIEDKLKIEDIPQRIESAIIELKDIVADLTFKSDKVSYNPERLLYVEERLSLIYTLQKRYDAQSVAELIAFKEQVENKLSAIDDSDETIVRLRRETQQLRAARDKAAELLTASRKTGGDKFALELEKSARTLAMPNIKFEVKWEPLAEPDINGAERAVFYFSANKNTPLTPVAQSASGGEISRLMLCIKAMTADVNMMPTIFFDEVDSGISGETASRVGQIMADISHRRQIIVITHLPQVAAKGSAHYKVSKDEEGDKTSVYINLLSPSERVAEIARMMSGEELTDAAIKHALELLNVK